MQQAIDRGDRYFRGSYITGNAPINLPEDKIIPRLCFRDVHCSGILKLIKGRVLEICIEGANIEGGFDYSETKVGKITYDERTRVNGKPFIPGPNVKGVLVKPKPPVLPARRSADRSVEQAAAAA